MIQWRHVLGCLQDEAMRARFLELWSVKKWSPDDFARSRHIRVWVCETLIQIEDQHEIDHPRRRQDRRAVNLVRAMLERELWT